jgi:inorganic pyrophosphatase
VAAFLMQDEAGRDAKVLCVPASDNRWDEVRGLSDVRPSLLEEIGHFFEIYKALEPDKATQVDGWVDTADAERLVDEARARHTGGH